MGFERISQLIFPLLFALFLDSGWITLLKYHEKHNSWKMNMLSLINPHTIPKLKFFIKQYYILFKYYINIFIFNGLIVNDVQFFFSNTLFIIISSSFIWFFFYIYHPRLPISFLIKLKSINLLFIMNTFLHYQKWSYK